jgi:hypothetical protein
MKRYGIAALALVIFGFALISGGIITAEEKGSGDACPATSKTLSQKEDENIICVYGLDNISSFIYHSKQEHFQMGRDGNAIAEAAKEEGIRQQIIAREEEMRLRLALVRPGRNGLSMDPSTIDMDIKIEVIEKGEKNKWHKMKATYKNIKISFWDDNVSLKYDISDSKDYQSAWNDLYAAVCMKEKERDKAVSKGDLSYAARALNFKELLKTLSYTVLNNRSFLFELKPDGSEIKLTNINDVFEASLVCFSPNDVNYNALKEIIRTDAVNNIKSIFPPVKNSKYKNAKLDNRLLKYENTSKETKDKAKEDKTKVIDSKKKTESEKFTYCPTQQLIIKHEGNNGTYDTSMDKLNWTDSKEWRTYSVNLVEVKK